MFKRQTKRTRRRIMFFDQAMPKSARIPTGPASSSMTGYALPPAAVATDQALDRPTLDPASMTQGAQPPPGMYQEMLLSLPLNGVQDVYWTRSDRDSYRVYQRNTNNPMRSALIQSYPITADTQFWFDQTATHFRVFRVQRRKPMDIGATDYGRLKAGFAGDRARTIARINAANKTAWRR